MDDGPARLIRSHLIRPSSTVLLGVFAEAERRPLDGMGDGGILEVEPVELASGKGPQAIEVHGPERRSS